MSRCLAPLALALLLWDSLSLTAQEADSQPIDVYVRLISQAQSEIDADKRIDAQATLNLTDKALRSFDFDYVSARARNSEDGLSVNSSIRTLPKPEIEVRYAVLNQINRQVVYICRDGGIRLYDAQDPEGSNRTYSTPRQSAIWTGVFSHDGKIFLSGHQNGEVLVWDAKTWEIKHTVALDPEWPVRELVCAPDGSAFVAESKQELQLWSLADKTPKKVAAVGDRYNFGEGLAFSPRGDKLATGGMFDIQVRDAATGNILRSMTHASYTMGLQFSPDGQRIASAPRGNVNRFLAVFDIDRDAPLFNAGPFGNYIVGLAFTPDGKRIAATGCEKILRLFDAATGRIVLTFKRPECGSNPAFSRDGQLLGWSEPDGFKYIELQAPTKPN